MAILESSSYAPARAESPRLSTARQHVYGNRRVGDTSPFYGLSPPSALAGGRPSARPESPLTADTDRTTRAHRFAGADAARREQNVGYSSNQYSGGSSSTRGAVGDAGQSSHVVSHVRQNPSIDGLTMSPLPANSPVIRFIHTGGQTKVLNIRQCKSADDVTLSVLKKLQLPEHQPRSYCFYVLDDVEPNPSRCRKLAESDLMEIFSDSSRPERGRLIFKGIHEGEPDHDELRRAAQLASDENQRTAAGARNQYAKIEKLTGESWRNITQPTSPNNSRRPPSSAGNYGAPMERNPRAKLLSIFGSARPPSEMIIHEIMSYFPSHQKEIENTMRMSLPRNQRISRAASRLSVTSSMSHVSSLKDAPPIPSIADTWLNSGVSSTRSSRPLSVSKFNLPALAYRDSDAGSLQPLQEEDSPLEPNRRSYVSFDSSSDDPANSRHSLLESASGDAGDNVSDDNDGAINNAVAENESLNERLSVLVAEDGEEEDAGLEDFLNGNNFAAKNWMKGSLIGEGSFGSVFLALHAITGELMAVKQVEIPSAMQGTEFDQRKNNTVTALKHEIELLQGLHHSNIVRYLGTSADDHHLNIFLEYVPGGSIASMLKQYNTFQEPLIKRFVQQILAGLSYLHSRDIIHRDIKGANILVDNKGQIKISDFGISKRVEASTVLGGARSSGAAGSRLHRPSLQGSVYWMAPEVVRQTAHTKKADIWSLGCLVVEMFLGAHPFPDCSQLQAIFAIGSNQARPPPPPHASKEAVAFLDMTFQVNYELRPSANELLECQFLKTPIVS